MTEVQRFPNFTLENNEDNFLNTYLLLTHVCKKMILRDLHELSHLILKINLSGKYYLYFYVQDEKTNT